MSTNFQAQAHRWQTAELTEQGLGFGGEQALEQALDDGFFFIKKPPALRLDAGDRFAQNFYRDWTTGEHGDYQGYRRWTPQSLAPRQGYHVRSEDQVEQFFLESAHWGDVFPGPLEAQAEQMRDFGVRVLRGVLAHLDVPRGLWDQACGGCLSGRGTYHLTFNHFRPEVAKRGLNIHKDSGWVTILRSIEPGLEVLKGDRWCPIDPKPDHFIVNFGCAMEILTRDTKVPVSAVAHRVRRQGPPRPASGDRFSYALFIDNSLDESICPGLFRYNHAEGLVFEMSFDRFLTDILSGTYNRDTQGLY